ncbi:MAG: hypothetical protein A2176_12300 [Spirochaetes bacterium RBG_13_51_14]|nr:MAG: hypothetical protein A2176_12300 [Spirochaetes bacterium RBG_13_51_14]
MAAKSVNQVKYLMKGKESRKMTLIKEMRKVEVLIAKLKLEMKNALKQEKAAKAKKAKAKKKK